MADFPKIICSYSSCRGVSRRKIYTPYISFDGGDHTSYIISEKRTMFLPDVTAPPRKNEQQKMRGYIKGWDTESYIIYQRRWTILLEVTGTPRGYNQQKIRRSLERKRNHLGVHKAYSELSRTVIFIKILLLLYWLIFHLAKILYEIES